MGHPQPLRPMLDKARMLKRRFENVVTYLKHRITNAASESINSKVQWVKYTARGFRNKANFVTAIYFHCGGLRSRPDRPTKNPESPKTLAVPQRSYSLSCLASRPAWRANWDGLQHGA